MMVAEGRGARDPASPAVAVVAQASFDCDDAPLTIEVYEKAAPDPSDPAPGARGAACGGRRPSVSVGDGYAVAPPIRTRFGFVGSIPDLGPIVVDTTSDGCTGPSPRTASP